MCRKHSVEHDRSLESGKIVPRDESIRMSVNVVETFLCTLLSLRPESLSKKFHFRFSIAAIDLLRLCTNATRCCCVSERVGTFMKLC